MNLVVQKLIDAFSGIPGAVGEYKEFRGEATLCLSKEALLSVCLYARDHLGFNMLLDIATVDFLGEEPRFQVIYELYNLQNGTHLRIKTSVDEEASVCSVTSVWPAADWHEREAYDMMGIRFEGHPNLTRIIMWEGYPDHPLRKDFPLQGRASEVKHVAFTEAAPLGGGPFVTLSTEATTELREPRSREMEPRSACNTDVEITSK